MKLKLFLQIISFLLALKAVFGVLYLVFGWSMPIMGWVMPTWLIVVTIIICAYLSYLACKFSKGKK